MTNDQTHPFVPLTTQTIEAHIQYHEYRASSSLNTYHYYCGILEKAVHKDKDGENCGSSLKVEVNSQTAPDYENQPEEVDEQASATAHSTARSIALEQWLSQSILDDPWNIL